MCGVKKALPLICRELSLRLSCWWLGEDMATSEPDQKGQETNISTQNLLVQAVPHGVRRLPTSAL